MVSKIQISTTKNRVRVNFFSFVLPWCDDRRLPSSKLGLKCIVGLKIHRINNQNWWRGRWIQLLRSKGWNRRRRWSSDRRAPHLRIQAQPRRHTPLAPQLSASSMHPPTAPQPSAVPPCRRRCGSTVPDAMPSLSTSHRRAQVM
jgi:hypothetical protein